MFGVEKMAESGSPPEQEWEGRRKSEEEVYTLLFKEVDSEGRGEVAVSSLIDTIHQIQLGSAESTREEVYDSHDDVSLFTVESM